MQNVFTDGGEVVEYRAAASDGQWYWTEGPAKPADDDQEDDSTQSADLHDLSGTQFWSGGSADDRRTSDFAVLRELGHFAAGGPEPQASRIQNTLCRFPMVVRGAMPMVMPL